MFDGLIRILFGGYSEGIILYLSKGNFKEGDDLSSDTDVPPPHVRQRMSLEKGKTKSFPS